MLAIAFRTNQGSFQVKELAGDNLRVAGCSIFNGQQCVVFDDLVVSGPLLLNGQVVLDHIRYENSQWTGYSSSNCFTSAKTPILQVSTLADYVSSPVKEKINA